MFFRISTGSGTRTRLVMQVHSASPDLLYHLIVVVEVEVEEGLVVVGRALLKWTRECRLVIFPFFISI